MRGSRVRAGRAARFSMPMNCNARGRIGLLACNLEIIRFARMQRYRASLGSARGAVEDRRRPCPVRATVGSRRRTRAVRCVIPAAASRPPEYGCRCDCDLGQGARRLVKRGVLRLRFYPEHGDVRNVADLAMAQRTAISWHVSTKAGRAISGSRRSTRCGHCVRSAPRQRGRWRPA